MTDTSANNKRIAKNTLFLYFRQILVMAVSLYTFVAMFNILSGALSVAIGRFITYEMGQPDVTTFRLQRIFSSSLLIQVAMGLIICLLIGTFGVWFVENKMVIPADRMNVTLYVLGFSTLSFFINLLSVPYNALIIAHEQMKAFAYISIVEVVLKLVVAYLLIVAPLDKLWLYALSMVLVSLIVRGVYAIYCGRHFEECRFVWGFDRRLLSQMFVFSGRAFLYFPFQRRNAVVQTKLEDVIHLVPRLFFQFFQLVDFRGMKCRRLFADDIHPVFQSVTAEGRMSVVRGAYCQPFHFVFSTFQPVNIVFELFLFREEGAVRE